jgi:hypothetical protein
MNKSKQKEMRRDWKVIVSNMSTISEELIRVLSTYEKMYSFRLTSKNIEYYAGKIWAFIMKELPCPKADVGSRRPSIIFDENHPFIRHFIASYNGSENRVYINPKFSTLEVLTHELLHARGFEHGDWIRLKSLKNKNSLSGQKVKPLTLFFGMSHTKFRLATHYVLNNLRLRVLRPEKKVRQLAKKEITLEFARAFHSVAVFETLPLLQRLVRTRKIPQLPGFGIME